MISRSWLYLVFTFVLASQTFGAPASGPNNDLSTNELTRRQYDFDEQKHIQAESKNDPVGATDKVLKMPNLGKIGASPFSRKKYGAYAKGFADDRQVPWFDNGEFPFTPTKSGQSNSDGAWKWVPGEFEGFKMKTDLDISSDNTRVTQPYYMTTDGSPESIKRVVISLPGRPRDAWKYANLFYNARKWVYAQNKYGIEKGDVAIVAPVVLNEDDRAAGGTNGKDSHWAVYRQSNWEFGGSTQYPEEAAGVSFYTALDKLIEKFMDKAKYPNVNKIVVAGHSMGGQSALRYAILKHKKSYDDDIMFWVGNPGSYTWLVESRPTDRDCEESENEFPYGLDKESNFPKYVRQMLDNGENTGDIVNRFRSRNVHYSFGLLDNGPGDTHCEAYAQGANHLQRGAHFIKMLDNQDGGFPDTHGVSYIAGVSHQDYPMIAAEPSMEFVFGKDFN